VDDLTKRRPEDANEININQKWEIAYWSKELGITQAVLLNAVELAGPYVEDVRKFLKKNSR
jgi:hypothetical protein